MRKLDEIKLYAAMRAEAKKVAVVCTTDAANALGMNHNRAFSLVAKWMRVGWCDGCGLRYVYFYAEAPIELLPWGVVQ